MTHGKFFCSTHQVFVYQRGGLVQIGEITNLVLVRWSRVRDDISTASFEVGPYECCDIFTQVKAARDEVHIYRDGIRVWVGMITRLEFDADAIRCYAEDMLWVMKRRALEVNVDYSTSPVLHVDYAFDLLRTWGYDAYGDAWNMAGDPPISVLSSSDDIPTRRKVQAYSVTIWEELDRLARYGGIDYACVNRQIYVFDTHYAVFTLPDLLEEHISEFPRIVEYGNSYSNRVIRTNGSGFAGIGVAPVATVDEFGAYVDLISDSSDQDEEVDLEEPTAAEIADWQEQAEDDVSDNFPPPVQIVVPANSTLMPNSPWEINDMIPGAWFIVNVDRVCRNVQDWHKLQEVNVEETGTGETVKISSITAPANMIVGSP